MKKYIALLLCVALLMGVTACGKDTPKDADTAPSTTQSTVTTTEGEGSTTTANSSVTTTTSVDGTAATTLPTTGTTTSAGTGTPSTTVTKAPSSTGSQSTALGSTPTSSAPPTITTRPSSSEPDVVLPAIGSDIDVTKQKNRIRVSAASVTYNADGTIAVSLTFKNHSSNWITEETDWVEYTCYDANGNVAQKATRLSIGCIDTKKHAERTFTFTVPANTAEVRITRSKIVYWTEWS